MAGFKRTNDKLMMCSYESRQGLDTLCLGIRLFSVDPEERVIRR